MKSGSRHVFLHAAFPRRLDGAGAAPVSARCELGFCLHAVRRSLWLLLVPVYFFANPTALAARVWIVAQHHPAADDAGEGTVERPFRSIGPAARQAGPGDTVRVYRGVYRERVAPARGGVPGRPLIYEAVEGEEVVISGSDVLTGPWQPDPDGLFSHSLAGLAYEEHWRPYRTALRRLKDLTCGILFADGIRLVQARSRSEAVALPGSWWYEAATDRVWVHFPPGPRPRQVEAAVRERVFAPHLRGVGHITVRGFVIQHAANQFPSGFWVASENGYPQAGAIGTRSGHDWVIERNVIRENANLGLDVGVEGGRDTEGNQPVPKNYGRHLVRANVFEANGCGGIAGYRSTGVRIVGNTIRGTNWQGHTAPETAGIKLHFAYDGRIQDNQVHGNDCYGIWLDNVYTGARVERNLVHNNSDAGIFVEMGGGPAVVAWNVVTDNRGDGIYLHDASDVIVAHNLLALNRQFGFQARTVTDRQWTDRDRGGVRVTVGTWRVRVENNLFIDNGGGALSLPTPSATSGDNVSDHNLYLAGTQWRLQIDLSRLWHLNLNDGKVAVPPGVRQKFVHLADAYAGQTGFLTLADWRTATGLDGSSRAQIPGQSVIENGAVERGGFGFRGLGASLFFRETRAITTMVCPPIPAAGGTDYFNQPVSAETRPGPFQKLPDGEAALKLWPKR